MIRTALLAAFIAASSLAGCAPSLPENTPISEARWLKQNWSDEERYWFHHATQGASTLPVPYDWLVALEQPRIWFFGDPPMLTDPEYLRRFGFIPSPASLEADPSALSGYGYGAGEGGRSYGSAAEYDPAAFPGNPDALPVGFARTPGYEDPVTGRMLPDQVGFTCAACHTGHLEYEGVSLRIDGAPAMTDLGKFREVLGLALVYTKFIPSRFTRFAKNVLKEKYSRETELVLAEKLDTLLALGQARNKITDPISEQDVTEGFTRLDALNRIGNWVFFTDLMAWDPAQEKWVEAVPGVKGNYVPLSAPVNYPHIWDTSWFNWVQYDASIMQPMVRNAGEAMGVSAKVNMLNPKRPLYGSSVEVREIFHMEQLLAGDNPFDGERVGFKGLTAPEWPAALLGEIDETKRDRGEKLYRQLCQSCHLPPVNDPAGRFWAPTLWTTPNDAGERYLKVKVIPITHVGTDPAQAEILVNRKVTVPAYLDIKPFARRGASDVYCFSEGGEPQTEPTFAAALAAVVEKTVDRWYDKHAIPEPERNKMNGYRPNCIQAELAYKARPLDGIWATAPYLHNGAVPDLWSLLSPAEERPASFCLGSRLFDPQKVGYSTECLEGTFKLDASKPGNLNSGHEFKDGPRGGGVIGRALTEDERWDLIEYLKSL